MDLLRATVKIANVFESGKYAVMHREGKFENDVDRWNSAVKEWSFDFCGNDQPPQVYEQSWRIYCAAT